MGTDSAEKLKLAGWVPRFTASGSRLQEAIDNYTALGFETKLLPAKDLGGDGCTECFSAGIDTTMMIYTRPADRTQTGDRLEK